MTTQLNHKAEPTSSLLRNTAWLAWSGTLGIVNGIVLWVAMARWREASEVGQFSTVMSIYTIFMTLCSLGLSSYLASEIARRKERRQFVASAMVLVGAWSLVSAAAMALTGYAVSQSSSARFATIVLSLAMLPTSLISVGEAAFLALGRARVIALATTTENLLRSVIPLFLLYRGETLAVICFSLVLIRVMTCVVYAIVARRELSALREASWPFVREIIKVAPTFAGVTILASVHWQIGTLLVNRLGGEEAAADFGVASRFMIPVTLLLTSYVNVLQPMASRLAMDSLAKLGSFLSQGLRIAIALGLPLAIGGLLLGRELLVLLFGARYAGASVALGLLGLSIIPFSVVMITARGLVATGRQRVDLYGNLAAVASNVACSLVLIPFHGASGAAAAQLLSATVMAAVEVGYGTRPLFQLNLWRAIRICAMPLSVMTAVVWLAQKFGFLLALALGCLSYLIGLAMIWDRVRRPEPPDSTGAEERRLRVLMVGSHTTRTLGGIATTISNLLRSPLARECEFRHIASQADDSGKIGKVALALVALFNFTVGLIRWRPDVAYVHVGANVSLYRKVPFIVVARLLGHRVVTHFHAGDFDLFYQSRSWLGQALIGHGIGSSHLLIAVSETWEKRLRQIWPHAQVCVVPHAIKINQFKRNPASNGSSLRLLFVGAMGRLKGESDLIKALQTICPLDPSLRLIMLGNGANAVKPLLHSSKLHLLVEHIGPVAMDQCADFYKRADLFVLPTYAECLPISMLEAMAAGLPIVSTTVGGIPDLIEDGVEGYLVAPGDVEALADRIARLINNPAERQRMGERARVKALHYDEKLSFSQLSALLRQASRVPNALVRTN